MRTRGIPSRSGAAAAVLRGLIAMVTVVAAVGPGPFVFRAWCDPPASQPAIGSGHSGLAARGYRRIFVPADQVGAWPRDGRKYIPVEEPEFNRWLARANAVGAEEHALVTIDEADYRGSLDGDGQLSGRGEWKITVRNGGPAFLALPNESFTPRNARWRDRAYEPVRLGSWGTADGGVKEFGLMVPHSGRLEFDWSIRSGPRKDALEVPWDVPAAVFARLALELRDDQTPSLEGAAVLESALVPPDATAGKDTPQRRRWVFAHGPAAGRQALRISSAAAPRAPAAAQLELRGRVAYQVEARGLEIQADWRLAGRFDGQRELTVPLPAGVQLLSVAADGQELGWRIVRNAASRADEAIVSLPREIATRVLDLKLALWQPLAFDQSWQLPTVWPKDVFWGAAEISLSVSPELELRKLVPLECQQTEVSHVGADSSEVETFTFAAYSPSATVEAIVGRREADVRVSVGTSLALTDPDVIGKLVTRWDVSRGQVHRLTGALGRGWSIEAVETIPADAMAEWFVDRRAEQRNLEIRLTDAVAPTREVSVIVTGRLQRFSAAEALSADTLRMVRWNAARVTRHLLSFQTSEPYVVEAAGSATRVARDSLNDADLELLEEATGSSDLVDLTNAGDDASLQLVAKRGQYTAEIDYEADCTTAGLTNSWRIVAHPRSNAVDRLLVYSTAALGGTARWTETGSDLPISAELLAAEESLRNAMPKEGELWLLRLPRPSSTSIRISLTAASSLANGVLVPMLALPEATEQSGLVTVRAPLSGLPRIEVKGLEPLPIPGEFGNAPVAAAQNPVRLAYRYAPQECLDASRAPQFEVSAIAASGTPLLTVRHLGVESFYSADGRTKHRATYELHNDGASEFKATLAENTKVMAAYVEGLPVPLPAGGTAAFTVPLAPRVMSPTVTVIFETMERRYLASMTMTAPVVRELCPVLTAEWTTWLPEGLECAGDGAADEPFDWRRRIFGYLASSNHARAFDPLRRADWADLIGGVWGRGDAVAASELPSGMDSGTRSARAVLFTPVPSVPTMNVFPTLAAAVDAAPVASHSMSSQPLGWRAVRRVHVSGGVRGGIIVSHPATMRAWAVACLIISFLLNRWARAGWRIQVFGITLACCVAVVLPAAIAPLATGVIWGIACSMVWSWLTKPGLAGERSGSSSSTAAVAVLAAVLATFCGGRTACAEPNDQAAPREEQALATAHIENVLIPMDARRQPVGTKIFVSEQFLRDLLAAERGSPSQEHQWLISGATYTGELTAPRRQAHIAAGVWALAFHLETFVRQAVVRLPLHREDATWQPAAMLDGVPQPIAWSPDGRSSVVTVPEPGRYILTVFCTPKTEEAVGRGQLRLAVPSLPVAKLVLHVPEALTDIQIPETALFPTAKDRSGIVVGEMFRSEHIGMSWPLVAAQEASGQRLSISELSWLRLDGRGGELTTKLIVEGGTRRPETLTVRHDERWTLLTAGAEVGKESRPLAGERFRTLQVPFPKDDIDRQEVVVRWKLSDKAEIGNIRVPPIAVLPTPTTQRWFAVTVDPAFDCMLASSSIATTTSKDFQNKWGNDVAASAPQIVLANVPDDYTTTFSLRPREVAPTVREQLHVAVGSEATRVVYQADVMPGSVNGFQLRLNVPANLTIDRAAVVQGEQEIPVRWTREDRSRITVLFGEAVTSDYRLTVSGSVPNANGQPSAIPRITAETAAAAAQVVQLYRDDRVRVGLQGFPEGNDAKLGVPAPPPAEWLVRPLGAFALSAADASGARLVVTPNQPIVQGDMLACLKFDEGNWWAEMQARLTVAEDDLGALRLRVPSSCPGPFEIEASVPVTWETKPQEDGSHIVSLRFGAAVSQGEELAVRVRTPLVAAAGPAAAPDMRITPFAGRRYVGVPRVADSQTFEWTNAGVEPAELPPALRETNGGAASFAYFEVVNESFTVALRPQAIHPPVPRVRLAETSVAVDGNGAQVLVSRFVIIPDGLTRCLLTLPAGQQLLSAELDGRPALVIPTAAAEWRVTLESARVPQVLRLVCGVVEPELADAAELARPSLLVGREPLPTDVSLWTVVQAGESPPTEVAGATAVSEADFAALRFDRLVGAIEKADASLAKLPRSHAASWSGSWVWLLRASQAEALDAITQLSASATISQNSYSAEDQIRRATARMEAWMQSIAESSDSPGALPPAAAAPARLPDDRFSSLSGLGRGGHTSVTRYAFEGGRDRIALAGNRSVAAAVALRILTVCVVIGVGLGCVRVFSSPSAGQLIGRWPCAVGVVVGLLYWSCLWPAWVGLLIVAASLGFAVRSAWPRRAIRPEASTVLRTRTTPAP